MARGVVSSAPATAVPGAAACAGTFTRAATTHGAFTYVAAAHYMASSWSNLGSRWSDYHLMDEKLELREVREPAQATRPLSGIARILTPSHLLMPDCQEKSNSCFLSSLAFLLGLCLAFHHHLTIFLSSLPITVAPTQTPFDPLGLSYTAGGEGELRGQYLKAPRY